MQFRSSIIKKEKGPACRQAGFTLVEMVVSVGLFAVVMLVCVSALLALVAANRKVHSLQSVMNNLNVTLDGLDRTAREGSTFHCGGAPYNTTQDCASTSDSPSNHTTFAFEPYGQDTTGQPTIYRFVPTSGGVNGHIERSVGGNAFVTMTSSDVIINSMQFYVVGSTRGCTVSPCDLVQPKVVIVVQGTAPVTDSRQGSTFHIQITAVQRVLDL